MKQLPAFSVYVVLGGRWGRFHKEFHKRYIRIVIGWVALVLMRVDVDYLLGYLLTKEAKGEEK